MNQRWVAVLTVTAGLVVPIAIAVALVPARAWMGSANVALVLVVLVVAVSATGRRDVAIAAAFSSAIGFDVFHTEPYGSLAVARREELITVGLVLLVGVGVAEVATWGRRQRTTAERTISDVSVLRSVAEVAAEGEDPEHLVFTAAFWLRELLDLDDCRLEYGAADPDRAVLTSSAEIVIGSLIWDPEQGMPRCEIELAVRGGGEVLGHFVLTPRAGVVVHPDRLLTCVALGDLVGIGLAGRDGRLHRG
jgi:hypothetical protein